MQHGWCDLATGRSHVVETERAFVQVLNKAGATICSTFCQYDNADSRAREMIDDYLGPDADLDSEGVAA